MFYTCTSIYIHIYIYICKTLLPWALVGWACVGKALVAPLGNL